MQLLMTINLVDRVKQNFIASIESKKLVAEVLSEKIALAAETLVACLFQGNKILSCGNGGSACDAEHFACELVNRFLVERRELPVIALTGASPIVTSIANDFGYAKVFSKQVRAFGKPGDLLFAISTSGNSENILHAVREAQQSKMQVIVLSGKDGGKLHAVLRKQDIELLVPVVSVPRVQEIHLLIIHCLCDLIDQLILPSEVKTI